MTQKDIRALLEQRYDRDSWKKLIVGLFNKPGFFGQPIAEKPESKGERAVVKEVTKLGEATLADGELIGFFEVRLQPSVDMGHNRVSIRKAVEGRIKWQGLSGALIVFTDPDKAIWRFSFYSNTLSAQGRWDTAHRKRYTYLLGEGEKCRTAAEQFDVLAKNGGQVTLKDLLEAFSVEKVSKAFFREYKEHYQDFVEHLTGKRMVKVKGKWVEKKVSGPSPKLAAFFNGNEKDARDFCKKLMGRLVFLYFLQKKRWLGATATTYKDGEHDFVFKLFGESGGNDGFYPNVLVDLFFDTLNAERKDDNYTMPNGTTRKVPFLNGGLFDMDELDRKTRLLTFPPALFSNPAKAEDPDERGFLDFLNAYNFTVHEAGPEEQTLAVDPEMLGHIFENLLEDNKDKGAFYTPKEIVHYMCQESLVQYLKNYLTRCHPEPAEGKVGGLPTDLEDHLRRFLQHGEWAELSPHSGLLLKALRNVKVCDPAIGSGAFPMGILHEIFQCVERIHDLCPDETERIWELSEWSPAEVKLRIIQHSIYGVDIERGAVDIARLRFWLSIIVDERAPRTLPNLDYKIVMGDSLLGRFNGEVLEIDWDLKGNTDRVQEVRAAIDTLHAKTALYFRDQPKAKKEKLEQEIRALKIDLLTKQLELNRDKFKAHMLPTGRIGELTKKELVKATEQKVQLAAYDETLGRLRALAKQKDKPLDYFDWQLDFPEVLNANVTKDAGFDIVIGNPPYVSSKALEKEDTVALGHRYKTAQYQLDLYVLFVEKGIELMRAGGVQAYITPNSWLKNMMFSQLRKHLLDNVAFVDIVPNMPGVFDAAAVDTSIFIAEHKKSNRPLLVKEFVDSAPRGKHSIDQLRFLANDRLVFNVEANDEVHSIIETVRRISVPLENVADITRGVNPYDKARGQTEEVIANRAYHADHKKNKSFVPELRGKHLHSFIYKWDGVSHISYGEWLAAPREWKYFTGPRLIMRQMLGERLACTIINEDFVIDQSIFIAKPKAAFLEGLNSVLGALSSKLLVFYFRYTANEFDALFPKIKIGEFKELPVSRCLRSGIASLNQLVQRRLDLEPGPTATALEREIDVLVCKLYGLSWAQAKVVDPELALSKAEYDAIALPPEEEAPGGRVSDPGVTGLTDEGTLFGQPVEEAPTPQRTPSRAPESAPSNGQAQAAILKFLRANTGWHGKSAILESSGVDAEEWNATIKQLLDEGKVERQGEKKGAKYRGKN